jgi:branched-chain amino acid transport system ATP-binding protein
MSKLPLLQLEGLSKRFGGVVAVHNVDLDLWPGQIKVLIGANGAGKTTLFSLIGGSLYPDSGSIRFDGRFIINMTPFQRQRCGISQSFQVPRLVPNLSTIENLFIAMESHTNLFSGLLKIKYASEVYDAAYDILEQVKLTDSATKTVSQLTHAHRKKLDIACALAQHPKLLLLDEPTAGLSRQESKEIAGIINSLEGKCAVLVIEHDLTLLLEISASVILLERGRIVLEGKFKELVQQPLFQQAYLGKTSGIQHENI